MKALFLGRELGEGGRGSFDLSGIRDDGHGVEKFRIYFAVSFPMLITKRIMIIRCPKILRFDPWFTLILAETGFNYFPMIN